MQAIGHIGGTVWTDTVIVDQVESPVAGSAGSG